MPLKEDRRRDKNVENKKKALETRTAVTCRFITPGPKYQLKTLVGHKNHCISRYRNPAYTFGSRHIIFKVAASPGPKYMIEERRPKGFTFGHIIKRHGKKIFLFKPDHSLTACYTYAVFGPGPKYMLPDIFHSPFFSIKWRTTLKKTGETPGPYYIKPIADAPAFSIGLRTAMKKPVISAGPYSYSLDTVKPRAPMYTIASTRRALQLISEGPGPIYAIPSPKPTPAFSFGVKHSKCAPPYITECDEQC